MRVLLPQGATRLCQETNGGDTGTRAKVSRGTLRKAQGARRC